jgi:cytochrome c oxidase subunit 2
VILYSILTCRAPRGDWTHGHPARSDWRIEALWTIGPLVFVLWIAAQSYSIYQQLNIQGLTPIVHHLPLETPAYAETKPTEPNQPKPTTETIEVIAKQWVWLFRYPSDGNRGSITSTELHLPVNQSVTMKLQSEDVLHGFYVPEFRVKQDIIPNRAITFVFTPIREGKYRLQDSQLSGAYFALMGADVYVESPEAYRQWLTSVADRPPTPAQNPAFSEYSQRPKGWTTVRPAQPLVNAQPLPL